MHRRVTSSCACLAAAAMIAAGCTRGDDADNKKAKPAPKQTFTERPVDLPEPDAATLSKDLATVGATATKLGCSVTEPKLGEPEHLADIKPSDWSSNPPSSGKHFPNWAPWGFYDEQIADGYIVHNLEHGGVALWYGDALSKPLLTTIRESVLDDLEKWVVLPRKGLDGFASTSWGAVLYCDGAALKATGDDKAEQLLNDWYDAVQSRGSESEKDLAAIPPAANVEELDPPMPKPLRDISDDPLF